MNERISEFIRDLKGQLHGLPEEEINEAVRFYEEYLNEAVDEGKDLDTLLKGLESPEKIAGIIRTETIMNKAERNPGLRNFSGAFRNAFKIVTKPLSVFSLAIVAIISYSMVVLLFGGAFAALSAAFCAAVVLIYEGVRMPSRFFLEIAGAFGTAFMSAGVCMLLAVFLYRCGRLFIRLSTRLIRIILGKPGRSLQEQVKQEMGSKMKSRRFVYALLVVTVAGTVLFGVSGLPWKYFTIFNSMKPEDTIKEVISEYDPGKINKISIVTAHSIIRIMRNSSDKIIISYEQPDWLNYEIGNNGSMLSFYEKSNGKLPLFYLVKLHESRTEVVISLPGDFSPDIVNLESTGGHIFISGLAENIRAKTLNGSINFNSGDIKDSYSIKANTRNGSILMKGVRTGQKVPDGIEYYKKTQAGKILEFLSTNGIINLY